MADAERGVQRFVIFDDFIKDILAIADHVHFIDSQYDMAHAHQ